MTFHENSLALSSLILLACLHFFFPTPNMSYVYYWITGTIQTWMDQAITQIECIHKIILIYNVLKIIKLIFWPVYLILISPEFIHFVIDYLGQYVHHCPGVSLHLLHEDAGRP